MWKGQEIKGLFMKKILFCLFVLASANVAIAQENIPVFIDPMPNTPNIGRTADPLDKLVLTPDPLPEIELDLSKKKNKKQITQEQKPTSQSETQTVQSTENIPQIQRTQPVSFKKQAGIMKITRKETEALQETTDGNTTDSSIESSQTELNTQSNTVSASQTTSDISVTTTTTISRNTTAQAGIGASQPLLQSAQDIENLFGKTHDVRGFELSGISLGMTPDEVIDIMGEMGFKRTEVRYGIPMFRSAFYEQNCRDRRVHILNEVRNCIESQADRDGVKYISSITFKKPATKEYIRVLFSSYATDNQAFKIYYESEGDNSLTLTQRNLAKQMRRKEMFWRMMFENYGLPDDSEQIVWGDPQTDYMQAIMTGSSYNAYIVLEDKEIQDEDYFTAEDDKENLKYRQQFTFAPSYDE